MRIMRPSERMIWGEDTHNIQDVPDRPSTSLHHKQLEKNGTGDQLEPVSGHNEQHDHDTSGVRTLEKHYIPSPRHSIPSPNNLTSPPRRRPRGSDAGKSIHKAAEAPQPSPGSSVNKSLEIHFSASASRRVATATQRRASRIAAVSHTNISSKAASTTTPQLTHAIFGKRKANNLSEAELSDQPLVADRDGKPDGLTSTSNRSHPQVARKTPRGRKTVKKQNAGTPQVQQRLPMRAARKSSVVPQGSVKDSSYSDPFLSSSDSSQSPVSSSERPLAVISSIRLPFRDVDIMSNADPQSGSRPDSHDNSSKSPFPESSLPSQPGDGASFPLPSSLGSGFPSRDVKVANNSESQSGTRPHGHDILAKSVLSKSSSSSQRNMKFKAQEARENSTDSTSAISCRYYREARSPDPNLEIHRTEPPSLSSPRIASVASISLSASSRQPGPGFITSARTETSPIFPGTGETSPPQPLVDAFECLFVYPLYLHRTKRLPFLLRNVRTSFRALCQILDIRSKPEADAGPVSPQEMSLTYEYISPSGALYTYNAVHPWRECPVCSMFGVFSNWEALRRHLKWDHSEIECEFFPKWQTVRIVVRRKEHALPSPPTGFFKENRPRNSFNDNNLPSQEVKPIPEAEVAPVTQCFLSPRGSPVQTSDSRVTSQCTPRASQKIATFNETHVSSHGTMSNVAPEPTNISVASPLIPDVSPSSSSRSIMRSVFNQSKPPTPPPKDNPHGAAHPIIINPEHLLANVQPKTYRPTGPHLYDHLSSLPLTSFGHQAWFVLDKEEETYELVDVLDEDKVICALWSRWILLNRPFFIGNYLAGIEAFVDEYWLIIHHAAGWGALRAWLLVLVSRRFLKNVELVQVLKRYNELIGKDMWPKI